MFYLKGGLKETAFSNLASSEMKVGLSPINGRDFKRKKKKKGGGGGGGIFKYLVDFIFNFHFSCINVVVGPILSCLILCKVGGGGGGGGGCNMGEPGYLLCAVSPVTHH